jgi:hypothetical protein
VSELNLPACPICHAKDSLSRQTIQRAGQSFVWYECRECGSVLLWTGDNRWAYQRIGHADKGYLLKKPMTPPELSALAVEIERVVPTAPPAQETPLSLTESKRTPKRSWFLPVTLGVVALFFICAVIGMLTGMPKYQANQTAAARIIETKLSEPTGNPVRTETPVPTDTPIPATVTAAPTRTPRPTNTPRPTATPTMTVEELKAAARQIPYDELARNTENHVGELVYYKGEVIQVVEGFGQQMDLRVYVTEGEYGLWDDLVWVHYKGLSSLIKSYRAKSHKVIPVWDRSPLNQDIGKAPKVTFLVVQDAG